MTKPKAKKKAPAKTKEKTHANPADNENAKVEGAETASVGDTESPATDGSGEPSEQFGPPAPAASQDDPSSDDGDNAHGAGSEDEGHKSDNLDELTEQLASENIAFSYERCEAKDGSLHWNYTATAGDEEQSKSHTGRIVENATEHEIKDAYEEILAVFAQD